jgi:TonB family protein
MYFIIALVFFFSGHACTGKRLLTDKDQTIKPPVLLNKPEFIYPEEAQTKGIEGIIDLFIYVDEKGDVRDTKIVNSSLSDLLDEAAKTYVAQMDFKPAMRENQPIGIWVSYKIQYTLIDSDPFFSIDRYLRKLDQYLNDAQKESGNKQEQAIQLSNILHMQYINYVKEHPENNYNPGIAANLTQITIDQWEDYFDLCPLTFILYDDLLRRFPQSNQISTIKEQIILLIREDLTRAMKAAEENPGQTPQLKKFAQELTTYLNQNYPDYVSEPLRNELKKLNELL